MSNPTSIKPIKFAQGISKKKPKKAKVVKKHTAFHLPARMKEVLNARVLQDLKSNRKKSEWIIDAIYQLLADASWRDIVLDGEMAANNDDMDRFYCPQQLTSRLEVAVKELETYAKDVHGEGIGKRQDPLHALGISKSALIRSAISYKMFPKSIVRIPPPPREMLD